MKPLLFSLLLVLLVPVGAQAGERLFIEGRALELRAQAQACYLGFIELYNAEYFRDPIEDGSATRCVRLSYLRDFSASQLDEATRETYRDLHGEAVAERHRAWLERIGIAYRAVRPGDRYLYCVDAGGAGALLRDEVTVASIPSNDFARSFLQIWVRSEGADQMPDWRFGRC